MNGTTNQAKAESVAASTHSLDIGLTYVTLDFEISPWCLSSGGKNKPKISPSLLCFPVSSQEHPFFEPAAMLLTLHRHFLWKMHACPAETHRARSNTAPPSPCFSPTHPLSSPTPPPNLPLPLNLPTEQAFPSSQGLTGEEKPPTRAGWVRAAALGR